MALTGHNVKLSFDGAQCLLTQVSAATGIHVRVLYQRWRRGDRNERLIRPLDNRGRKRPVEVAP